MPDARRGQIAAESMTEAPLGAPNNRYEMDHSSPPPLDGVRDRIRFKHYRPRTEQPYLDRIKRFIHFHGKRHSPEVEAYLRHLTRLRQLASRFSHFERILPDPLAASF
jgi:hypothetical protein